MRKYGKDESSKRDSKCLEIVLIRPGVTDFDAQGRIVGDLDVPLSETGLEQARCAAAELAEAGVTAVYSGPSLAAQQTAVEITASMRVRPRVEQRLKNVDMGLWQGRELEELKTHQPRFFRQWQENPEQICPPEGETLMEVRPRVDAFLKRVSRKHKSGVVVVVVADPMASLIGNRIDMVEPANDADVAQGDVPQGNAANGMQTRDSLQRNEHSGPALACLRTFQLSSGFVI